MGFSTLALAADDASPPQSVEKLRDLSIEDLGNIEIYSVSKSAEPLSDAPAAIYVITHEDIRRSGATSIPEMLRMAPNLEVARISSGGYAITARGFNGPTANKLLVLIDGRSVYTPLYSGVFWDVQGLMPEDIDRIEVISGPGATLWGPNAVNGVINITTRSAADTQGGLVTVEAGDFEKSVRARFGGKIGENAAWRVYGMGFRRNSTVNAAGHHLSDAWSNPQGGFRLDWSGDGDTATAQGDFYYDKIEAITNLDATLEGGNILGRWNHDFGAGSALQVQLYYDYSRRTVPNASGDSISVYDLDLQHSFTLGESHNIVWGGGYRISNDHFTNPPPPGFISPLSKTLTLGNIFVQDSVALSTSLKLTAGMKFEQNNYTGIQPLPSVRLSWKVTDSDLVWGAISRAVRTPSRIDKDLFQAAGPLIVFNGGPDFRDEKLIAYELGYRAPLFAHGSISVSTYYNTYDDLRSFELSPTGTFPIPIGGGKIGYLPFFLGNKMIGHTYGVEVWANYDMTDWWRLTAGYNALRERLHFDSDSLDVSGVAAAGNDPKHQFSLRSSMDLAHNTELDVAFRDIGRLPNPAVPGYTEMDVRLGWQASENLELSLAGYNLLHARHAEFGAFPGRAELQRNITASARWTF